MITAERYHDISCGHRVVGHENKCAFLHGHNYRIHFTCAAIELDIVGRVIDFGVMKAKLCDWLEEEWDHKFLVWKKDPFFNGTAIISELRPSLVFVPFNPTAENMARHLLHVIGPMRLNGGGVKLIKVTVEETRKCSATVTLEQPNGKTDPDQ